MATKLIAPTDVFLTYTNPYGDTYTQTLDDIQYEGILPDRHPEHLQLTEITIETTTEQHTLDTDLVVIHYEDGSEQDAEDLAENGVLTTTEENPILGTEPGSPLLIEYASVTI